MNTSNSYISVQNLFNVGSVRKPSLGKKISIDIGLYILVSEVSSYNVNIIVCFLHLRSLTPVSAFVNALPASRLFYILCSPWSVGCKELLRKEYLRARYYQRENAVCNLPLFISFTVYYYFY